MSETKKRHAVVGVDRKMTFYVLLSDFSGIHIYRCPT